MPARQSHEHTEVWQQLKQYCLWPEQRRYEQLRPIVLFGDLPGDRAAETGASERTLRRQADDFDAAGMASLFRPTQQQVQVNGWMNRTDLGLSEVHGVGPDHQADVAVNPHRRLIPNSLRQLAFVRVSARHTRAPAR